MWETNDGNGIQDVGQVQSFIDALDENMKPDMVNQKGFGMSYYFGFNRRNDVDALHKYMGRDYNPTVSWVWRIRSKDIINWTLEDRTAEDMFGEFLYQDCQISSTYGNDYNRHEFHMYVLPSFVQGIAAMMAQDERAANNPLFQEKSWPIFDYDSLWQIDTDKWDREFSENERPKMNIPQELIDIQREWIGTDGNNYVIKYRP